MHVGWCEEKKRENVSVYSKKKKFGLFLKIKKNVSIFMTSKYEEQNSVHSNGE